MERAKWPMSESFNPLLLPSTATDRGPDAAAKDVTAEAGGRYGGGRYGGAFQFRVDATAEPPDTHITMDAMAGWG